MDYQQMRDEVMGLLSAEIDPIYLKKIQISVPTEWTIIGVRVPKVRAIVAGLHEANKAIAIDDLVAMLDQAFAERHRELVITYIFWLQKHRHKLDATLWPAIDRWVGAIVDWEICDQLAMSIGSTLVASNPALVDELIAWTGSDHLWRRRFTVATAASLNHKGRAGSAEALRICLPLLNDDEKMVRKAVGWALRESSKHDPDAAFELLLANKATAHRTVLREGSEKLPTARRELLLTA